MRESMEGELEMGGLEIRELAIGAGAGERPCGEAMMRASETDERRRSRLFTKDEECQMNNVKLE